MGEAESGLVLPPAGRAGRPAVYPPLRAGFQNRHGRSSMRFIAAASCAALAGLVTFLVVGLVASGPPAVFIGVGVATLCGLIFVEAVR